MTKVTIAVLPNKYSAATHQSILKTTTKCTNENQRVPAKCGGKGAQQIHVESEAGSVSEGQM